MLPVMSYDKYEQSIIRPLAHVKEAEIIQFAEENKLRMARCLCGLDTRSQRRKARHIIEYIADQEGEHVRERMFEAMHNPKLRYLMRRAEHEMDLPGFGQAK